VDIGFETSEWMHLFTRNTFIQFNKVSFIQGLLQ